MLKQIKLTIVPKKPDISSLQVCSIRRDVKHLVTALVTKFKQLTAEG